VRLFDRTRTNVELGDAGAAMLAAARTAVDAAVAADEVARAHAQGEVGELRLGLSPGAHYLVQPLLAEFARRRPRLRVQARQDSSSVLAEQVAPRQLELALGFCAEPVDGVVCEPLREEPVVIAVARERWSSGRGAASLAELSAETFALVDAHDGAAYNRAVEALCRAAGFEPHTPADPRGPMAWETAVRAQGCVGLTTRSAASSTARGIRRVDLIPTATFRLDLVEQGGPPAVRRPAARAFADLVRARLARDV